MNSTICKKISQCLLLGVALLLPVYYWWFNLGPVSTNLLEVLVVALFLVLLFLKRLNFRDPVILSMILVILGLGLGTIFAPDKVHALGIIKSWFIVPMMLYFSARSILEEDQSLNKKIILALSLNVLFVSVYAVLQRFGVIHLLGYQEGLSEYVGQGRALAFFESPNYLAMYLVPLTLWLFFQYRQQKIFSILTIAAVLLSVGAIILSDSRAGLLALIAGFIIGDSLLHHGNKRVRKVLSIILATGVVLVIYWGFSRTGSDEARLSIWQAAWEMLRSYWLLGIGPGQYRGYLENNPALVSNYEAIKSYAYHAHSLYLETWLSGGILAVAGGLSLVFMVIKKSFREASWNIGALSALSAIFVQGLFDTTYFKNDLSVISWLLIAVTLSFKEVKQDGK